jgi:hypothetical protein
MIQQSQYALKTRTGPIIPFSRIKLTSILAGLNKRHTSAAGAEVCRFSETITDFKKPKYAKVMLEGHQNRGPFLIQRKYYSRQQKSI